MRNPPRSQSGGPSRCTKHPAYLLYRQLLSCLLRCCCCCSYCSLCLQCTCTCTQSQKLGVNSSNVTISRQFCSLELGMPLPAGSSAAIVKPVEALVVR